MPAASLPAPEPLPAAARCSNCGRLVAGLLKGRCRLCHEYKRKQGRERPAHLWNGKRKAAVWKPAEVTDRCDCGRVAVWRVKVAIGESARTTLLLCEGCAEIERAAEAGK